MSDTFIANNVYILKNVASGTVLDLDNGSSTDGTKVQGWEKLTSELTYDQQWLISEVSGSTGVYTLRNLRSGTYLDLNEGSNTDGTKVQGWEMISDDKAQQWTISDSEDKNGHYRFKNVQSGTYLDLDSGSKTNGTQVQGWEYVAKDNNQFWDLTRVSRTYSEVLTIVEKEPFIPKNFTFSNYRADGLYIVIPDDALGDSYSNSNLSQNQWRDQIFEYDDFAIAARVAVTQWVNGFLLADGITVLFGITFGQISGENCSYNWYLNSDLDKVVYFDPQNGTEVKPPSAFKESFNLF